MNWIFLNIPLGAAIASLVIVPLAVMSRRDAQEPSRQHVVAPTVSLAVNGEVPAQRELVMSGSGR
jgi:hypothetical protein